MNDQEMQEWSGHRVGGKSWYVLRHALAWSVVWTTIFVLGQIGSAYLFRKPIAFGMDLIGPWVFSFVIVLGCSTLWLSLKWDRNERRYLMDGENDRYPAHNEWK